MLQGATFFSPTSATLGPHRTAHWTYQMYDKIDIFNMDKIHTYVPAIYFVWQNYRMPSKSHPWVSFSVLKRFTLENPSIACLPAEINDPSLPSGASRGAPIFHLQTGLMSTAWISWETHTHTHTHTYICAFLYVCISLNGDARQNMGGLGQSWWRQCCLLATDVFDWKVQLY